MKFIHPLLMVFFFFFCYRQVKLGLRLAGLKEKSPEFVERPKLIEAHRQNAYILLVWGILGLIGGVIVTSWHLKAPVPFVHTYGHGFFGVLVLSLLIVTMVLGFNIKHIVKPKIRERFFRFHANIRFVIWLFGFCSLITGIGVLIWGISAN